MLAFSSVADKLKALNYSRMFCEWHNKAIVNLEHLMPRFGWQACSKTQEIKACVTTIIACQVKIWWSSPC